MNSYTQVHKPLDQRAAWFPKARFGMFIHFGLYSLLERDEWAMRIEAIPRDEYQKLMHRFNPKRFSAREWVDVAKRSGARYMTVTAKHHDGFCLFDSALTDFKITRTPFGRDLIREVVDECHRVGMRIVLYYSQPDWTHPSYVHRPGCGKDWPHADPRPNDKPDWDAYLRYYFGQVEELCTKYGRIDGIWFDGMNKAEAEWRGRDVYRLIKRHQPHAVVNDRAGYGDYFTPERRLSTAPAAMGYMVEAIDCVARGAWSYLPDPELRSSPAVTHDLIRMAAAGGNFLLNIGPKPDGSLPATWAQRFLDVGRWLRTHGDAIYDVAGCPRQEESPDQLYTRRGKRLYLHLLRWPDTSRLTLRRLTKAPTSARLIGAKDRLTIETAGDNVIVKGLPANPPDAPANVVELTFKGEPSLKPAAPFPVPPPLVFNGVTPLEVRLTDAAGVFLSFKGLPLPTHAFKGQLAEDLSNIWLKHHKISWALRSARAGWVDVTLEVACAFNSHGSTFVLRAGKSHLTGTIPQTSAWTQFTTVPVGRLYLRQGAMKLTMFPKQLRFPGRFGVVRKIVLSPTAPGGKLRSARRAKR